MLPSEELSMKFELGSHQIMQSNVKTSESTYDNNQEDEEHFKSQNCLEKIKMINTYFQTLSNEEVSKSNVINGEEKRGDKEITIRRKPTLQSINEEND